MHRALFCFIFFLPVLGCGALPPADFQTPMVAEVPIGESVASPDNPSPKDPNLIKFVSVGASLSPLLIDLEFLPGQGGEALVATLDGKIHYLRGDLTPLDLTQEIPIGGLEEQGLFNLAADPDYANNHMIFIFYNPADGQSVRVDRFTVDFDSNQGSFSLSDAQNIIEFPKSEVPVPESFHNGGGMDFDGEGRLWIALGDSTHTSEGSYPVAQDPELAWGKIHRIIPNRVGGVGGYTVPPGNFTGSLKWPSISALGFRNPFTAVWGNGACYVGDVGSHPPDGFEEINAVTAGGQSFGWPLVEGFVTDPNHPEFLGPLHGYLHADPIFDAEDPDTDNYQNTQVVGTFYQGSQYGELLDNRLIYSGFFKGWVRGLELGPNQEILSDLHLGHFTGISSLQEGPDGYLYAVTLGVSDKVLRLELKN